MSEPVVIPIVSEGVAKLLGELRTIDQTIAEMERRSTRATEAGARQRTNTARSSANEQKKVWQDAGKQAEAFEKQKARIIENSARMAGQVARRQADEEIKQADRAAREKLRATERSERERQRIVDNSARMAGRIAERAANAEIAAMKRAQEARARFMTGMAGKVGSSVAGVARGGLTMLGGAAMAGAGYAVADAARDALAAQHQAALLSNSAYNPLDPNTRRRDTNELVTKASSIGITANYSKLETLKGLTEYVRLSSDSTILDPGNTAGIELAKIAKSTGTDFTQLMSMTGNARVQNKTLGSDGLLTLMRSVVGQGKAGAVELEDLVQHGGEIMSTSGKYGGDQTVNQGKLIGLAQFGRRVTDVAEAATSVRHLASDVSVHADKLEAAGIHVKARDAKGNLTRGLADPAEIIANLMAQTGGDTGKLKKLGIGERSMKLFDAATTVFNTEYDKANGTAEQRRASASKGVLKEISGLENASYRPEDVDEDFKAIMRTDSEKFDSALTHIRETLETKLTPYLDRFADGVAKFVDSGDMDRLIGEVAKVVEWFAANPLHGLGDVLLAAVTKDVAAAAIGVAVKKALETSIGGMIGAGLTIATAAITAEQVGELVINQIGKADADKNRHAVGANIGATNAVAGLHRVGGATASDIASAKARQTELAAEIAKQKDDGGALSHAWRYLPGVQPLVMGSAEKRDAEQARALAANEAALKNLTAALNAAVAAQGGGSGVGGGAAGGSDHDARNKPIGTGGARQ